MDGEADRGHAVESGAVRVLPGAKFDAGNVAEADDSRRRHRTAGERSPVRALAPTVPPLGTSMLVGVAAPLLPAAVETMPLRGSRCRGIGDAARKQRVLVGRAVAGPLISDDVELAVSPTGGGSGVE